MSGPGFRFALVGPPNCGKTSLFNALTGGRQKVANYAGVTVECREGRMTTPSGFTARLLDLPGILSLNTRSPDAAITREVLLGRGSPEGPPDVVVCIADATRLVPALRLALEVKTLGIRTLVVLNMMDVVQARGRHVDPEVLARGLGLPVVESVAVRRKGVQALRSALEDAAQGLPSRSVAQSSQAEEHFLPGADEAKAAQRRAWHMQAEKLARAAVVRPGRASRWTDVADRVLLHPVGGLVSLALILFVMFQSVFVLAAPMEGALETFVAFLGNALTASLSPSLVRDFLTAGVVQGVGGVLVFLPQIGLLFTFIALLEYSGYMTRAAFLMDRLMGGVGLHGRSFIPLLSCFACAVPGIMATRAIENPRDRLVTILVAPLMTCSARLPVYTLIVGAMIPKRVVLGFIGLQGLTLFGLYALGIGGALLVAWVLKKRTGIGVQETFLVDLPDYKIPLVRNVGITVALRLGAFIRRAGTVILGLMILVWAAARFPQPPPDSTEPALAFSFAGRLGHALAPLMAPLGFDEAMTVALIPAMAAREVAVAALGTLYAVQAGSTETVGALSEVLRHTWSLASALAFLVWFVFAPQCLATLAVIGRETGRWVWSVVTFTYLLLVAYGASFLTYQTVRVLEGAS